MVKPARDNIDNLTKLANKYVVGEPPRYFICILSIVDMTDMSMWANIRLRRLRVFPQMCAAYAFMTPDLYFSFRML